MKRKEHLSKGLMKRDPKVLLYITLRKQLLDDTEREGTSICRAKEK